MAAAAETGEGSPTPHRDWSALTDLPLAAIAVRLRGLVDFHAFGKVCRGWRLAAKVAEGDLVSSLPPFLFWDFLHRGLLCPAEARFYRRRDLIWKGELDGRRVIGCSHGHLILLSWQRPWILNPLTGAELRGFPCSPPNVLRAVLSSHPASPGFALVVFDRSAVRYCRLGDTVWSVLYKRIQGPEWAGHVEDVALVGRRGYLLCTNGTLATFDLVAGPQLTMVQCDAAPIEDWNELPAASLSKSLVECDGELFLFTWGVRVADPTWFLMFQFDAENCEWRGLESLGDRALFVSHGRGGVLVDNRARWGASRDAVYYLHRDNHVLSIRVFRVARRDEGTQAVFTHQCTGKDLSDFHGIWVIPSL